MKKYMVFLAAFVLFTGFTSAQSFFDLNSGEAAVIKLEGNIQPTQQSSFAASGITPEKVRQLNYQARQKNAQAIVYEINSGGGAVVASKEVKRAIEGVDIPTVCRFRDVAASGGYMIALGCDHIVADSATLTGSIGVRSSYLQYTGAMEKLGISYINISTGKNKEIGSPYQNVSEREKQILKNQTEQIHSEFVNEVVEKRNLTRSQRDEIAKSGVYLGDRAEELGLVDTTGGRQTTYNLTEEMVGRELDFVTVEQSTSIGLSDLFFPSMDVLNSLPFTASY